VNWTVNVMLIFMCVLLQCIYLNACQQKQGLIYHIISTPSLLFCFIGIVDLKMKILSFLSKLCHSKLLKSTVQFTIVTDIQAKWLLKQEQI